MKFNIDIFLVIIGCGLMIYSLIMDNQIDFIVGLLTSMIGYFSIILEKIEQEVKQCQKKK